MEGFEYMDLFMTTTGLSPFGPASEIYSPDAALWQYLAMKSSLFLLH